MKVISIFAFCLAIAGCAAPAAIYTTKHAGHYQPTDATKGAIYVYRESEFVLSGRGIYILGNGVRIGGVNNGTYFVHEAAPGEFTVSAENLLDSGATVNRAITVVPGGRYYLRASFKSGFVDVRPYIEIVPESEGEQAVKQLSHETMAGDGVSPHEFR